MSRRTENYFQEAYASAIKRYSYPQAMPMSYDPFRMPPVTAVHKHSYYHQEQKHFEFGCGFGKADTSPTPEWLNGALPPCSWLPCQEVVWLKTNHSPDPVPSPLPGEAGFRGSGHGDAQLHAVLHERRLHGLRPGVQIQCGRKGG